jgi:hypothetical protein
MKYIFGDQSGNKWNFEDALKIYGTNEWENAKNFATANGYKKLFTEMEKAILDYQKANNLEELIYKNNVDNILKNQNYSLKGYESFANLGYDKYAEKYNERYNTGIFSSKTYSGLTPEQEKQIKEYLTTQGYVGIDNIRFKDNQFTYTHGEGETGTLNVEAIRKWDAEQAAAEGVKSVFDQSFDVLSSLHK